MPPRKVRAAGALLLMLAAACSGAGQGTPAQQAPPGAQRIDASRTGSLAGRVLIDGPAPANDRIRMSSDPFCTRANTDGAAFETFAVAGGGLDNVFVYVKDGLGNYYFDVPSDPVILDQQGCRYTPHVFGVRAGQPLELRNTDDTLHNVRAMGEVNQPFNIGQPGAGVKHTKTFTAREVMVEFKCDVHGWMRAYAGVLDHPYFAVTASGGRFELAKMPAGTYTIEAWHERLGAQTQTVTLADNETKALTFTFKMPAAAGD